MKKASIIIFLAVYSILAIGVNVMVHTCGGHSNAIVAPLSAKDPCACSDEMAPEDMCCKTEIKSVKIDDEQLAVAATSLQPLVIVDQLPVSSFTVSPNEFSANSFSFIDTSPPPKVGLHISNSVFLI